jgi:hypothetical protein
MILGLYEYQEEINVCLETCDEGYELAGNNQCVPKEDPVDCSTVVPNEEGYCDYDGYQCYSEWLSHLYFHFFFCFIFILMIFLFTAKTTQGNMCSGVQ